MMWSFLASDLMFFGTLIMIYMIYRGDMMAGPGPYPTELINVPFTSLTTFVLLMSSLAMVLGLSAIQRGNLKGMRIWLITTALLGLLFLGGEAYEYIEAYTHGLTFSSNLYGTSYYVLTGFHKFHVLIGVVWLLALVAISFRGQLPKEKAEKVEIAGLYWHFVDIIWIIIFTLVYLIPYE